MTTETRSAPLYQTIPAPAGATSRFVFKGESARVWAASSFFVAAGVVSVCGTNAEGTGSTCAALFDVDFLPEVAPVKIPPTALQPLPVEDVAPSFRVKLDDATWSPAYMLANGGMPRILARIATLEARLTTASPDDRDAKELRTLRGFAAGWPRRGALRHPSRPYKTPADRERFAPRPIHAPGSRLSPRTVTPEAVEPSGAGRPRCFTGGFRVETTALSVIGSHPGSGRQSISNTGHRRQPEPIPRGHPGAWQG